MTSQRPLLVAHAAGAWLAGGDAVAGVLELVKRRAEAAELDVRRTSDGVLVVHHDPYWNGMPLARMTHNDLVARGALLHTLADVLAAAAGRLALDVELKEAGFEAEVISELLEHVPPEHLVVTSFLDEAVHAAKKCAPSVRAGLLVGRREVRPAKWLADVFPFARLRDCGADFLAPHVLLLSTGLRSRARAHGIPLLLWTVRDPDRAHRYTRQPDLIGVITESEKAFRNLDSSDAPSWPFVES